MQRFKKGFFLVGILLLAVAMLVGCGSSAKTQGDTDYPKRAVTIIVPYAAGGGADMMARATAAFLEKELKQPFVVTIKAGASGAVGQAELARSKPDGYTIMITSTGGCTLAPHMNDVGYTNKEFAPIAQIADVPSIIATHKGAPYKTFKELVDYAEKNPETKLTYGTSGTGSIHNVAMEGFVAGVGKKGLFKHLPFKGGSEAVTALLGQHSNLTVAIATEIIPQMNSGDFIPLAISAPARYPLTPNVPTLKELGYKEDTAIWSTWYGFAAPAGTPPAIIQKLEAAIQKATQDPAFIASFKNINQPIEFMGSKDFTAKWMKAYDQNKKIIEAAGMAPKK